MKKQQEIIIEWVEIKSLISAEYNPRTLSREQARHIRESLQRFGCIDPIIVNKNKDRENIIIGGHQRARIAEELGWDKLPVVFVDLALEQERELNIRLNKNTGDFDFELLEEHFDIDRLIEWGFDDLELSFAGGDLNEKINDADDFPEYSIDDNELIVCSGDIWILGDHILHCSDGTAADKNKKFGCLIFDPPWDAECAKIKPTCNTDSVIAFSDCQMVGNVIDLFGSPSWMFVWDCVSSWYIPNRPLKRGKLALFYGNISDYDFDGAHYGEPGESKIVTNTRGTYEYVADKRGKHLSDVFTRAITSEHAGDNYKHGKPVDWIRMLIGNCTSGEILDPFCGSGTTIIAAEQLGRKCNAYEIDPAMAQSAVIRWQEFSKKEAVRKSDGMKI